MNTEQGYRELLSRLGRVRRAWRANAALQGLLLTLFAAPLPVLIGLYAGADGWLRAALTAVSAAAGASLILIKVLYPLLRPLNARDAARLLERRDPALEERLSSAVELRGEQARFSRPLLDTLVSDAAQKAGAVPLRRALNLRATTRAAALAAALFVLYAAGYISHPVAFSQIARFVAPPYLPAPEVYAIDWVSGDALVPTGGRATLRARLSGDVTGAPEVLLEREGLDTVTRAMTRGRGLSFTLTLDNIQGDTLYTVRYKKARSRAHRIRAVDPPRIDVLTVRLIYPKHTHIPAETRENAGDLAAPLGTRIELNVRASSPLKNAFLMIDKKRVPLKLINPQTAAGELRVTKDVSYTLHLTDRHGFTNASPPAYAVHMLPDAPPELELLIPSGDLTLKRADIVPMRGRASDDYGITQITLHYRIQGSARAGRIVLAGASGPDAVFESQWDLSKIAGPGDTIIYYVSAADNDPYTGPKSAQSATLRVTILTQFEEYNDIEAQTDDIIARLSASVSQAESAAENFDNIARDLASGKSDQAVSKDDVQRNIEQWQQLESDLNDVSDQMRENMSRMKDNDYYGLEVLQKYDQLQDLMNEIMTDEMRELMARVQKNLEQMDLSQLSPEEFEAMQMDQEQLLRTLDKQLKHLQRMQAEQKLDALASRLEDIAKRQERALERTGRLSRGDRMGAGSIANDEQQLASETEDALEQLDNLSKDFDKLDPDTGNRLGKMLGECRGKGPHRSMRNASENLLSGEIPDAEQNEQDALNAMLALSKDVGRENETFSMRMDEKVKEKITGVLYKILNLSREQERTLDRTGGIAQRPSPRFAPGEAESVRSETRFQRDVSRELAANLAELAALTAAVRPSLEGDALFAVDELNAALENLKQNQAPGVYPHIKNSYVTLNRIALTLLEARSGMSQGGQGSMKQFMDQLRALADAQEGLNSRTGQLGGSLPGLQSLAVEQRLVREGLERARGQKPGGQQPDNLGEKLDKVEEQMREVEQHLNQGRADEEVQHLQSNVLREMRDATLSQSKEDPEKRKAELGKKYAPPKPEALDLGAPDALPPEIIREIQSLKKESRIPGFEQAVDNYYRELNNLK